MNEPLIRVAINFRIGQSELAFETTVPQEQKKEELDSLVDKLEQVALRQMFKGQIAQKLNEIEQIDKQIYAAQHDYNKVLHEQERKMAEWELSDRRTKPVVTRQEQQTVNALEENIKSLARGKDMIEKQIEKLKELVT